MTRFMIGWFAYLAACGVAAAGVGLVLVANGAAGTNIALGGAFGGGGFVVGLLVGGGIGLAYLNRRWPR